MMVMLELNFIILQLVMTNSVFKAYIRMFAYAALMCQAYVPGFLMLALVEFGVIANWMINDKIEERKNG